MAENELDRLSKILVDSQRSSRLTRDINSRHWGAVTGKIVDVDDPFEKGRVKVALDSFKQQYSTEDWIPVVGAYSGKQPRSLLGQKVLISPIEGSLYLYRVVGVVDGDIGTYEPSTEFGTFDQHIDNTDYRYLQDQEQLKAKSGLMSRLAVYEKLRGDSLPKCDQGNHGGEVVWDNGVDSHRLTCLRYKGGFKWTTDVRKKADNEAERT